MRLWSIHPRYLDAKGLVALWREGLLALNVLRGNTSGYRNHPQLLRFKNTDNPVLAINCYLRHVADEADKRGYKFSRAKIKNEVTIEKIPVTGGQIKYEFEHLLGKLKIRSPELFKQFCKVEAVETHPIMSEICGDVENWERIQNKTSRN